MSTAAKKDRSLRVRLRALLQPLHSSSPEEYARGIAIGFFFGLWPVFGLQIGGAWLAATILGGNRIVACLMTGISNPLTAVPLYSFCYWVGHQLVPGPPWDTWQDARSSGLSAILSMGWDAYSTLWVGTLICGGLGAAFLYPAILAWLRRRG